MTNLTSESATGCWFGCLRLPVRRIGKQPKANKKGGLARQPRACRWCGCGRKAGRTTTPVSIIQAAQSMIHLSRNRVRNARCRASSESLEYSRGEIFGWLGWTPIGDDGHIRRFRGQVCGSALTEYGTMGGYSWGTASGHVWAVRGSNSTWPNDSDVG